MQDLQTINRELDTARERDDHQACVGLITAALALPESQPDRAGYLDELAFAYEKLGRFDEAIDRCAKRSPPAGTASSTIIPARRR